MRATEISRTTAPARVQDLTPIHPPGRRRRFAVTLILLALLWGGLTGWRLDALVFGLPAVLAGAMVTLILPAAPLWRLSLRGAAAFVLWFAVQSFRGAVDVAWRAFAPGLPLRPGFRSHPLTLPQGAPRILFLNSITLLPGTLSADIKGDEVLIHMLDTRADLAADLAQLEIRIRALFALSPSPEMSS
jgi:multicomponent Na+:H+ antiporter subunit E